MGLNNVYAWGGGLSVDGNWAWLNGATWNYTKWTSCNPSSTGGTMLVHLGTGTWFCDTASRSANQDVASVICELKL